MARLLDVINSLEAMLRLSAALPLENRIDVLELQKQIAAQVVLLESTAREAYAGDPRREQHQTALSALRRAVTSHRSAWPVVAMDEENSEYLRSLEAMRAAFREYFSWVRAAALTSS